MTEDLASVDIATKKNLDDLVKVGEGILDNLVSRVNSDTGDFEPVPDGGSNREALKRYNATYTKLHIGSALKAFNESNFDYVNRIRLFEF